MANIRGNDSNENVNGSNAADYIVASGGADLIFGFDGDDQIWGDRFTAVPGNDTIFGGAGNDKIYGDEGADILNGEAGADTIFGGIGDDQVNGGSENDSLLGNEGNDNVRGGLGDDAIYGGTGSDQLYGDDGTDYIAGEAGNDLIDGGAGFDVAEYRTGATSSTSSAVTLNTAGRQVLTGGFTDSLVNIEGVAAPTELRGDTVDASGETNPSGISINLESGFISGSLSGITAIVGFENIIGGAGDDILIGDSGVNLISGGLGNDTLRAGIGNDSYRNFLGNFGNDQILDTAGSNDALDLSQYNSSEATFQVSANNLVVSLNGPAGNGVINIQNFFNGPSIAGTGYIENIVFSNRTITNINEFNLPPTANNDAYTTDEDAALNIPLSGVLANDSDPNGNPLTASLVTGPTNGTLTLNADGSFAYTPNANFNGTDTFTYLANDGTGNSNPATVTITVNPVNDLPTATNDAYVTDEDTVLTIPATGVLVNDTDPENNPLTASLVTGPANGILTLNLDGSFVYTPNADFFGTDTFTYLANDGTGNSNSATVTINVQNVLFDDLTNNVFNFANNFGNAQILPALNGAAGIDQIVFTTTNDLTINLTSGAGDEVSDGAGNTVNWAAPVIIENVTSGAGNDTITGNDVNNLIAVGAGDDTASGGNGDDTINGGIGADTLDGEAGNDSLNGGAGADSLNGGDGNDTLNGGAGGDALVGGLGNDVYIVDDVADSISENAGEGTDRVNSSIDYTLGAELENLTLTGTADLTGTGNNLANAITGNAGSNTLSGLDGNDNINGGAGDDTVEGGEGNDILNGAAGADSLSGDNGNDVLVGGTEDDQLSGGLGNDVYQSFLNGFGNDSITDVSGFTNTDTINLRQYTSAEVTFVEAGNNLLITVNGAQGNGTITVTDFFGGDVATPGQGYIERIVLADRTITTIPQLGISQLLSDTSANDVYGIVGSFGTNFGSLQIVPGIGFSNTPGAANGSDTLDFTAFTNDLFVNLEAGAGDEVYDGLGNKINWTSPITVENAITGSGNDILLGNSTSNSLSGGEGDDFLEGNAGNDVLNGGSGSDFLADVSGNDTYVSSVGNDQISDSEGFDTLIVDALRNTVALDAVGTSLVVVSGSSTTLVDNAFSVPVTPTEFANDLNVLVDQAGSGAIENLVFTDGSISVGTTGADNLIGTAGSDLLIAGAGDDVLSGAGGGDILFGGVGNDTYAGFALDTGISDLIIDVGGASDLLNLTNYSASAAQFSVYDVFDANGNSGSDGLVDGLIVGLPNGQNILIDNYFDNSVSISNLTNPSLDLAGAEGSGLIEGIDFADTPVPLTYNDVIALI